MIVHWTSLATVLGILGFKFDLILKYIKKLFVNHFFLSLTLLSYSEHAMSYWVSKQT